MAIERDTVTIWHDAGTPKKAEWHRTIVTNVRVDWSAGSVPGSVGATTQNQMTAYLWSQPTIAAGDRIMVAALANVIGAVLGGAINVAVVWVTELMEGLNVVASVVMPLVSAAVQVLAPIFTAVFSAIASIVTACTETVSAVWTGVLSFLSGVPGSIEGFFSGVGDAIVAFFQPLVSGVTGIGDSVASYMSTANKCVVCDGDAWMYGRHVRIEAGTTEELTVQSGSQGTKRNDLVVVRYAKDASTGVETASLVVVKGTAGTTATDPTYSDGSILDGTSPVDMFVSWCFAQAGASCAGLPAASSRTLYNDAKAAGRLRASVRDAQPGDVMLFDWSRAGDDGDGDPVNLDHTCLCEMNLGGDGVQTIEGNIANGKVLRRVRDWSYCVAAIAPDYATLPDVPSTPSTESVGSLDGESGELLVDGDYGSITVKDVQRTMGRFLPLWQGRHHA